MNSYLDIKQTFGKIMGVTSEIDEESDIVISTQIRKIHDDDTIGIEDYVVTVKNDILKAAYNKLISCNSEDMQIYSDTYYEVALTCERRPVLDNTLSDSVNKIEYILGNASFEYILFVCSKVFDVKEEKRIMRNRRFYRSRLPFYEEKSLEDFIKESFGITTLRIKADTPLKLSLFVQFCTSFEYFYMYKKRHSVMKIMDLSDLYRERGGGLSRTSELDEVPRRTVNPETLEYYAMAIDSKDPFTAYISFYHVLEYYFDEAYKKNLIDKMKNKLTDPSFSYKSDTKIYDLAKWVGDQMKNADRDGRGDELASLKYVLEEYVPIDELVDALDEWDTGLQEYYKLESVSFAGVGKGKDKIAWSDLSGVYTNIANRIYNTRNALVHSKSGQSEKQYKPFKHKASLLKELPLIQVIAELIFFKDGKPL